MASSSGRASHGKPPPDKPAPPTYSLSAILGWIPQVQGCSCPDALDGWHGNKCIAEEPWMKRMPFEVGGNIGITQPMQSALSSTHEVYYRGMYPFGENADMHSFGEDRDKDLPAPQKERLKDFTQALSFYSEGRYTAFFQHWQTLFKQLPSDEADRWKSPIWAILRCMKESSQQDQEGPYQHLLYQQSWSHLLSAFPVRQNQNTVWITITLVTGDNAQNTLLLLVDTRRSGGKRFVLFLFALNRTSEATSFYDRFSLNQQTRHTDSDEEAPKKSVVLNTWKALRPIINPLFDVLPECEELSVHLYCLPNYEKRGNLFPPFYLPLVNLLTFLNEDRLFSSLILQGNAKRAGDELCRRLVEKDYIAWFHDSLLRYWPAWQTAFAVDDAVSAQPSGPGPHNTVKSYHRINPKAPTLGIPFPLQPQRNDTLLKRFPFISKIASDYPELTWCLIEHCRGLRAQENETDLAVILAALWTKQYQVVSEQRGVLKAKHFPESEYPDGPPDHDAPPVVDETLDQDKITAPTDAPPLKDSVWRYISITIVALGKRQEEAVRKKNSGDKLSEEELREAENTAQALALLYAQLALLDMSLTDQILLLLHTTLSKKPHQQNLLLAAGEYVTKQLLVAAQKTDPHLERQREVFTDAMAERDQHQTDIVALEARSDAPTQNTATALFEAHQKASTSNTAVLNGIKNKLNELYASEGTFYPIRVMRKLLENLDPPQSSSDNSRDVAGSRSRASAPRRAFGGSGDSLPTSVSTFIAKALSGLTASGEKANESLAKQLRFNTQSSHIAQQQLQSVQKLFELYVQRQEAYNTAMENRPGSVSTPNVTTWSRWQKVFHSMRSVLLRATPKPQETGLLEKLLGSPSRRAAQREAGISQHTESGVRTQGLKAYTLVPEPDQFLRGDTLSLKFSGADVDMSVFDFFQDLKDVILQFETQRQQKEVEKSLALMPMPTGNMGIYFSLKLFRNNPQFGSTIVTNRLGGLGPPTGQDNLMTNLSSRIEVFATTSGRIMLIAIPPLVRNKSIGPHEEMPACWAWLAIIKLPTAMDAALFVGGYQPTFIEAPYYTLTPNSELDDDGIGCSIRSPANATATGSAEKSSNLLLSVQDEYSGSDRMRASTTASSGSAANDGGLFYQLAQEYDSLVFALGLTLLNQKQYPSDFSVPVYFLQAPDIVLFQAGLKSALESQLHLLESTRESTSVTNFWYETWKCFRLTREGK